MIETVDGTTVEVDTATVIEIDLAIPIANNIVRITKTTTDGIKIENGIENEIAAAGTGTGTEEEMKEEMKEIVIQMVDEPTGLLHATELIKAVGHHVIPCIQVALHRL
jgi:predicted hydrolase (HD superfamily)